MRKHAQLEDGLSLRATKIVAEVVLRRVRVKLVRPRSKKLVMWIAAVPLWLWVGSALLAPARQGRAGEAAPGAAQPATAVKEFPVSGVIQDVLLASNRVVIQHDAVSNYMPAMTMEFRVNNPAEMAGLKTGDRVSFRLLVTDEESWIDRLVKTGAGSPIDAKAPPTRPIAAAESSAATHPLRSYKFTNELGQAVSLNDFRGQALAITFFFTRCPIPEYCPRLSKNFEEASRKLESMPGAPTNWHFLSVSFDTQTDTAAVLKAYAEGYHYDPAHWSFLTGPPKEIGELARLSDVTFQPDGVFFSHNFRTLIIDPAGRLQTTFPTGGNLADAIVAEILRATGGTNAVLAQRAGR